MLEAHRLPGSQRSGSHAPGSEDPMLPGSETPESDSQARMLTGSEDRPVTKKVFDYRSVFNYRSVIGIVR